MKLGSLREGGRDGTLVLVRRDLRGFVRPGAIAPTLQQALDRWDEVAPRLEELAADLERGAVKEEPLDPHQLASPLPRAYEWIDGSAYLSHIELVRRARGATLPKSFETDPLVYQGGSGVLLGPTDDIVLGRHEWGLDFESEVCVILGDTPVETRGERAASSIRLVLLCNDITLRNLVPAELSKGFGFFQSKAATAFSPVAVTPDELGPAWRQGRLHLPLRTTYNGAVVGDIDAGKEMHFSFLDLIAHITATRSFTAGTLLGSGTVSTADPSRGVSCLAERRAREMVELGQAKTRFLEVGDRVEIEMIDANGQSLFGRISQQVVAPPT